MELKNVMSLLLTFGIKRFFLDGVSFLDKLGSVNFVMVFFTDLFQGLSLRFWDQ